MGRGDGKGGFGDLGVWELWEFGWGVEGWEGMGALYIPSATSWLAISI
jgi:hypothetical protein